VPAATKHALVDLVAGAEEGGWTTRAACRYLELSPQRLERWRARVAAGEGLDDHTPGGTPVHGLTPAEEDEIVAVFNEWADVDRSHRKLAHRVRGNYVRAVAKGLALGMPIAPTMANHFLRDFDRAVSQHCGRLVRYADDACIMCSTAREAQMAEQLVTELLGALELRPNPAKSCQTSFDEGFRFLGFRFQGDAARPERRSQFDAPAR
jgi:hypothetical protein